MYIKKAKNRYQLIRTEYDPATKRGKQKLLGSVTAAGEVGQDVYTKLNDSEQEELKAFLLKLDSDATPHQLETFLNALEAFNGFLASTNAIDKLSTLDEWETISNKLSTLTGTMRKRHAHNGFLRNSVRLPAAYNEDIVKMRKDGLTYREIANKLSTSVDTVRYRYRKQMS